MKCAKVDLLKAYLLSLPNVTVSAINHATHYKFASGLIVDVFHTGTVRFQNEIQDPQLMTNISNHIESLNRN